MRVVLVPSEAHPLHEKLRDPERMYRHIRFGLMVVSGSDLNWMDGQIAELESGLSGADWILLRTNWKQVRVRLESEGYV